MITASELAQGLDDANAILCEWAQGTGAREWMAWLDQYAIDCRAARIILAAAAGSLPLTWDQYGEALPSACVEPDDYAAGSDLGGGSQACRWYEVGQSIIGYVTGGDAAWCVPVDADEPPSVQITGWSEGQEPDED